MTAAPTLRAAALAALLLASAAPASARPHYAATITRTVQGVPHVVARDMGGLGYGSGYTAAEDNGCVIAEMLLTVRGERSRWLGVKGTVSVGFSDVPNLESDFYFRAIGDVAAIDKAYAASGRDSRALIEGFAAGYNRYLRDHADRLAANCRGAAWVRPLGHEDMLLLVNGAMTQASSAGVARQIAGAAPPGGGPAKAAMLGLPGPLDRSGLGSNGWAFGSDRTDNRRGLLVGNPHFPWSGPNRFRRLHLTIPGTFDVEGSGLLFSPFVAIGFNKDVAWTHTVTTAQHGTLFELALDPADPTAYLVDGKREWMTRRAVTVEVKDGAPVTRTLYASRYGPMLSMPIAGLGWGAAKAYAVRDANQANQRSGDAWLAIGRAHSVEQIRDAIGRTLGIPYVNTIAADRFGHALYADVTPVPNVSAEKLAACGAEIGKSPALQGAGISILDGSRAACDWDIDPATPVPGLTPLVKLPVLIRTDYVQNSNDSYWLSNPSAPIPAHSPLLGPVGQRQNLRTRSAIHELGAFFAPTAADPGPRIGVVTARTLILGNKVYAADLALDDLLALCPTRATLAAACGVLAKWDRHADIESKGAVLFFAFWRRTGAIPALWTTPFDPAHPADTPRGLNPAAAPAILDALQAAVDEQAKLGIPLDVALGDIQVAPRAGQRIAIHGGPAGAGVLNAMATQTTPDGLVPVHGTSYVQVVGFDETGPVANSMLSYAQSSDPESPYYSDATRAFSRKGWLRLPFTPEEVAAQRLGPPLKISE